MNAVQYLNPIIAVKKVPLTQTVWGYTHILKSSQSTRTANITCVNELVNNYQFFNKCEQGQEKERWVWAIASNQPHQLYLITYWAIDAVDHVLKHCQMFFLFWKYWYPPERYVFELHSVQYMTCTMSAQIVVWVLIGKWMQRINLILWISNEVWCIFSIMTQEMGTTRETKPWEILCSRARDISQLSSYCKLQFT